MDTDPLSLQAYTLLLSDDIQIPAGLELVAIVPLEVKVPVLVFLVYMDILLEP